MFERTLIDQLMEMKRRTRVEAIQALRGEARARGESFEVGLWTLIHDLERAPLTTNLDQLAEIGVVLPNEDAMNEKEIGGSLAILIEGLAILDVYLLHTDHLDDRSLHRVLRQRILLEPVRDLPPGIGSREWIDLSGGMDRSAFLAVHASEASRRSAAGSGEWVPPRLHRLADRDRRLPRPAVDH